MRMVVCVVKKNVRCETKIYQNIMPLIQNTIVLSDIKLTLRFCWNQRRKCDKMCVPQKFLCIPVKFSLPIQKRSSFLRSSNFRGKVSFENT